MDIDHLRSWIGRTEDASDLVTPRLVASFGATFAPQLAPCPAGDAPLALHWCLAPRIAPMNALGPDGHPAKGDGFLPPVPLPRRMWAGGRIDSVAPLRIGDSVTRHSTIEDVVVKDGRTGPLCFVTVAHRYETERGTALRERHDIVYRPAGSSAASPRPPADARADLVWQVEGSPVLLFRYSALTFNGHRIHYDHPYVTQEEGYDGLVVHGPVQATLMFNAAATLAGGVPAQFDYRGLAPLVAGTPFQAKARREPDGTVRTWTEGADGLARMEGTARFG